jgi:hypothetical protein
MQEWTRQQAEVDRVARQRPVSPYARAVLRAGESDSDARADALRFVASACRERTVSPALLRFDHRLEGLRWDPRFRRECRI